MLSRVLTPPSSPAKRTARTICLSAEVKSVCGTTDKWMDACSAPCSAALLTMRQFKTCATGGIWPSSPHIHRPCVESVALLKACGALAWASVFRTYVAKCSRSHSSARSSLTLKPVTGRHSMPCRRNMSATCVFGRLHSPLASTVTGSSTSKLPLMMEIMPAFDVLTVRSTRVSVRWYSSPRMATNMMEKVIFVPTFRYE
mmetsp:Transcript_59750/g.153898  ORF Transcript_59750/g.153898 Transcript_59750/m.153898 type:complete len:200 (+) Transcript_59750:1539-2138(+)